MKIHVILAILLLFIVGCIQAQENEISSVSGIQELMFGSEDLITLGLTSSDVCEMEEHEIGPSAPLAQSSTCFYTVTRDNTEVVVQLEKFTNPEDLNGAFEYRSSHYRSSEGLLSENDYGDRSRFYVNNENDYGAEFNEPGVYFYSLWIVKDAYLMHVTSKGTEEAREDVSSMGLAILSKFG